MGGPDICGDPRTFRLRGAVPPVFNRRGLDAVGVDLMGSAGEFGAAGSPMSMEERSGTAGVNLVRLAGGFGAAGSPMSIDWGEGSGTAGVNPVRLAGGFGAAGSPMANGA
jgi:hypothetical protein